MTKYCSQCQWSTEERWYYPPRWYCLVNKRTLIKRDEQATDCEDYIKLDVKATNEFDNKTN